MSDWTSNKTENTTLNLKESIDFIFTDFCAQLSGFQSKNIQEIIDKNISKTKLQKQIEELELKIKREKQFNVKIEMYNILQKLKLDKLK
jgi:hypothetical protein